MIPQDGYRLNEQSKITFGILAGGQAARYAGRAKGLVIDEGKPLVGHLTAGVEMFATETIINCRTRPYSYALFANRLVTDFSKDYEGPLAGVLALLYACETRYLFILPCDVRTEPEKIFFALNKMADKGCVFLSNDGDNKLALLIDTEHLKALEQIFDSGERRLFGALKSLGAAEVQIPDLLWRDFNQP